MCFAVVPLDFAVELILGRLVPTLSVHLSTPGEKLQVPEAREDGCPEGTVDRGVRLHACRQRQG